MNATLSIQIIPESSAMTPTSNVVELKSASDLLTLEELENYYKENHSKLVIFAIMFILPKEVAEDVVQEVFVSLATRLVNKEKISIENLDGYTKSAIAMKAKNFHRNRINRERKFKVVENEEHINASQPTFQNNEFLELVNQFIDSLPHTQKTCIVLRYFEEMKVDDIANTLGISSGSVKTHLHRGVEKIKQSISEIKDQGN